jgi:hypothetical protein
MQTIQNTQANLKTTTVTMSLSLLNSQIAKTNSKLLVEFARNFGEDLLSDLMNVMRQLHNENQTKTERPSVEESFELMRENFQEVLDSRIEHMNNEVPRAVRGRKPKAKHTVAVEDTDDEGEKRGRPKKEEAKLEQTSLDSEQQKVLADAKKAASIKPKKAATTKKKSKGKAPKMFRRIERTVIKKNGKEKREKVWRKPDYELKDGEVFLNTWAVSEKTPNAKSPSFDNEADAFKAMNGETVETTQETTVNIPKQAAKKETVEEVVAIEVKQVVEEVVKQVEIVEKPPAEELKAEPYEEDEGIVSGGDEGIDGIENDDDETTVEVKTTTEENVEDDKIDIQKTFNPTEPYAPFTGVDELCAELIRFTDKTSNNYGKIINKNTLEVFGWVDPNDDEQYVEEQPDYLEEQDDDDDDDVIDCDWDF